MTSSNPNFLTVHVQYTAQLRAALGPAEETLSLPSSSCTLDQVVEAIHNRYGEPAERLLPRPSQGSGLGSILVMINESQVPGDPDQTIADGDRILFLSPISGGSESLANPVYAEGRSTTSSKHLTDEERAIYQWQIWVEDFGERGQEILKGSSVLISRCGGLGSLVAYELAAAGVGTLILAHAGDIKPSDLNRQLLMTHDALGTSRVASAQRRLKDLNPRINIIAIPENLNESNASDLVNRVDLIVDAAPLFEERLAMNRQAVLQNKPLVECAMYDLEATITTVLPGRTPCLACWTPAPPPTWKREFPVFGAVSGTVGCLGAMEAIKVLTGLGDPLAGRLLRLDLRTMTTQTLSLHRNPHCSVCQEES